MVESGSIHSNQNQRVCELEKAFRRRGYGTPLFSTPQAVGRQLGRTFDVRQGPRATMGGYASYPKDAENAWF
ncbi:unnamed protein product [Linum trigynum]|uniref:Uncharacterized protein n=1 Tax=Linum trigynum TaxID=586398 RepID=A0AAV2DYG0_9ROSI